MRSLTRWTTGASSIIQPLASRMPSEPVRSLSNKQSMRCFHLSGSTPTPSSVLWQGTAFMSTRRSWWSTCHSSWTTCITGSWMSALLKSSAGRHMIKLSLNLEMLVVIHYITGELGNITLLKHRIMSDHTVIGLPVCSLSFFFFLALFSLFSLFSFLSFLISH